MTRGTKETLKRKNNKNRQGWQRGKKRNFEHKLRIINGTQVYAAGGATEEERA